MPVGLRSIGPPRNLPSSTCTTKASQTLLSEEIQLFSFELPQVAARLPICRFPAILRPNNGLSENYPVVPEESGGLNLVDATLDCRLRLLESTVEGSYMPSSACLWPAARSFSYWHLSNIA